MSVSTVLFFVFAIRHPAGACAARFASTLWSIFITLSQFGG
jgi:hypothetical protein